MIGSFGQDDACMLKEGDGLSIPFPFLPTVKKKQPIVTHSWCCQNDIIYDFIPTSLKVTTNMGLFQCFSCFLLFFFCVHLLVKEKPVRPLL